MSGFKKYYLLFVFSLAALCLLATIAFLIIWIPDIAIALFIASLVLIAIGGFWQSKWEREENINRILKQLEK